MRYRELEYRWVTANSGREVSGHDRGRHPRQEAAQLTNFAFGEVEFIAKFATEFLGDEVGNHQLMLRQHVLEELAYTPARLIEAAIRTEESRTSFTTNRGREHIVCVWTPWA
jgi:hypothetical protein